MKFAQALYDFCMLYVYALLIFVLLGLIIGVINAGIKTWRKRQLLSVIFILIFSSGFLIARESQAQQSKNVESEWEWSFETANRIPDTVVTYDYNTSYPVPWYRIVKDSITCGVMRSPTGKQYFLYKYKVFLLDLKTEKLCGRR